VKGVLYTGIQGVFVGGGPFVWGVAGSGSGAVKSSTGFLAPRNGLEMLTFGGGNAYL